MRAKRCPLTDRLFGLHTVGMARSPRGREYTIAARHLSSFLVFIALPTLLVLLISGFMFRGEIVRITTEQRYGALEQTAGSIDSGMQEFALMASALINDRSLMEKSLEFTGAKTANGRYLVTLSLDNIFNRFFILTKQLGSFYVFFSRRERSVCLQKLRGRKFFPRGTRDVRRRGRQASRIYQIHRRDRSSSRFGGRQSRRFARSQSVSLGGEGDGRQVSLSVVRHVRARGLHRPNE